ncbi:XdhC family protein [Pseudooctadecabacter jejudonensis]|uniref:Putative xanthine dehydrogenase subunit A n=1 Tax=Pseudooctadecabacter jejudonensis TaxID=1391910 RepID=A0A1Y5RFM8_9RHOB|nr:XdhC/CoxI family protein [Pseudooctadecabacter jejudonensis]SLN13755.1 putative xanthine dehydrogenase subunit A [Pseudooctadecabacter jejudonensis]
MTETDAIPETALAWHRAGAPVAVATVVETWGSAPRPVGSQLVMDGNARMEGSVSGGCVEGAVIVEALEAMEDGGPRLLEFGVTDDEAFAVGLACGGRIRVLVEPVGQAMPVDLLETLVARRATMTPVAYVADLEGDARHLSDLAAYPDRFRLDRSGIEADGRTFVAIHNPPLRMVVVGGVHIAQHLIPMARACGYAVTLVDPRPAFASPDRFPDTTMCDDWPDEALAGLGLDARTAVVTLTHDPKLDDPAIRSALGAPVFYLGCLGSTRTHAKRVARLQEAGFAAEDIARIAAPVGLDIGGRSPAEIAVSIMAEVTARLRQGADA